MNAAADSLLAGLPSLPKNMSSLFHPTDADLLIWLGYMQTCLKSCDSAAAPRQPCSPWTVLGVIEANVEQLQRWLIDRTGPESELVRVTRERDQALLAARTNLDTIKAILASYDEETSSIPIDADPGCPECTAGTTPRPTGLCVLHRFR